MPLTQVIQILVSFFYNVSFNSLAVALSLSAGPLLKASRVLPQNVVKFWSCKIRVQTFAIALQFDRHLESSVAEMPVIFQSDTIIIRFNLAVSRFHELVWRDVRHLSEQRPRTLAATTSTGLRILRHLQNAKQDTYYFTPHNDTIRTSCNEQPVLFLLIVRLYFHSVNTMLYVLHALYLDDYKFISAANMRQM